MIIIFLFLLDAGQLCASCNGIAKVDDCRRFARCDNDEVMKQTKTSSNYPFYRRRDTVHPINLFALFMCFRQAYIVNLYYMI